MNKRRTGAEWERAAWEYLTARGMRILETNFRCRQGEVDLIGFHEGYLVFVEVKYRGNDAKGHALEAVDIRKQRRICKTADFYRYLHKIGDGTALRYDVVAIQEGNVDWVQNAFSHVPGTV